MSSTMRCRPRVGIGLRQLLVLVVVVVGELDLADPLRRAVAVDLDQQPDLEPPVARNPVDARLVDGHRALARERIAEGVEVLEQRMRAQHRLERPQQRRHEQPRDAPVQALGDAAVVALRELVVQVRVGGRIAEAREQLARVVADVAVVDRDHARHVGREHVAVGEPGASAPCRCCRCRAPRCSAVGRAAARAGRRSRAGSEGLRSACARRRRSPASRSYSARSGCPRGSRRPAAGSGRRAAHRRCP